MLEVKRVHCNCIHRGRGGHHPPMSGRVTFDPWDVEWGQMNSDRERIILRLDAKP